MISKVKINLLATGVPGLDEILGGGLPEYSFNLIAGSPGCGKTTLAHQIMFALATPERPALYFTVMGEPPLKMLRYQQQFDFFDHDAIGDSIRFMSLTEDAMAGHLDRVLQRIVAEVETHNASLVFVDSFRSVVRVGMSDDANNTDLQQFIQQLGTHMAGWQATTFLVGEYGGDIEANPVHTVSDGLICLQQSVQRNSMVRKIEIMKMRGRATLPGLHTFRISDAGIKVFAPVSAHLTKPATQPPSGRALTGVPGLDDMLAGGIPRGYSLLVAGPSGSGKSLLAASFLAEGARCGETGVIAVFEQDPNRSNNRLVANLVAEGSVAVVDSRAPDLSIDEILQLVLDEIRRLGASRVVIDSLSGFELSLAPTFREDFRENLARMVTALARAGVTVLMTSELEDRYTDLRFSPYGTAFLTDAIIVQRYIEVDSRLLRMMAVVKLRGASIPTTARVPLDASACRGVMLTAWKDSSVAGRNASRGAMQTTPVRRREPKKGRGRRREADGGRHGAGRKGCRTRAPDPAHRQGARGARRPASGDRLLGTSPGSTRRGRTAAGERGSGHIDAARSDSCRSRRTGADGSGALGRTRRPDQLPIAALLDRLAHAIAHAAATARTRSAVRGSRRLQADQRHPGPPGGRRGA